jgi:asparagine synthase (glutamine-hydrolysing)
MSDVELSRLSAAPSRGCDGPAASWRAAFHGRFVTRPRTPLDRPVHFEERGLARIEASGLQIRFDAARVDYAVGETSVTLCHGRARRSDSGAFLSVREIAGELDRRGGSDLDWLGGRFAIIHLDLTSRTAIFVSDRFAVHPICYRTSGDQILFSDRADSLRLDDGSEVDLQSIYNYVYFHVIPAPRTVFRGVARVEPAQVVRFGPNGLGRAIWWQPRFEPDPAPDLERLKSRFRVLVQQAVEREATTENIGTFLSGGTDSSTVAGMLCRVTGRAAHTFSIGFDAAGYDEMAYARIAAQHFGTEQHEYYLSPEDLLRSIPDVASHYDQPFGNSSALPAYYCALRAKECGIDKLLAGDGGDELYGGNSRYAKQKVFELYYLVPQSIRAGFIEPTLLGHRWPHRLPLIRKLASYVEQARVPLPDRLETYNLLNRFGAANVFSDRFLAQVWAEEPIGMQREIYGLQPAASTIDRMLAYDWRFTLADNDLVKVTGTSELARQTVGFPFLDDDLVDFSMRLAPDLKVRRQKLRYFFKCALRGFLPDEILQKRKHGFGLPFGPWLVRHPPLQAFARSAIERLADRGVIRRDLVQESFSVRLQEHAGYYGEMIWILMMLEHWLEANVSDFGV